MLQTAFATPPALPGSSFEAPSGARLTWVFEAGSEPNAPVLLAAIRRSCRAECAPAFLWDEASRSAPNQLTERLGLSTRTG